MRYLEKLTVMEEEIEKLPEILVNDPVVKEVQWLIQLCIKSITLGMEDDNEIAKRALEKGDRLLKMIKT